MTGGVNRMLPVLDRTALIAILVLPLLLMHAHGIGEAAIVLADFSFLTRSVVTRHWAWLRTSWMPIGLLWWAWVVLCSLPLHWHGAGAGGPPSLIQALATVRFLILVAAVEHAVLRDKPARTWFYRIIAGCAAYIALQSLLQFLTGYNLYGVTPEGSWNANTLILTGPFDKQRAGPPLSRILLPVLVPLAARLLERGRIAPTLAAGALLSAGVAVMVLIGQRIPFLLVGLGLLVVGLLLPRLRPVVLATCVAGVALLALTPVVAPGTFRHLVLQTSDQVAHFGVSPYGELYARALEIGEQQGATGLGFDGFNYGCPEPRYFRPSFDGSIPDGGGASICWHHPHNFYLEALDNGGFIGLGLFCALAVAWLAALGRGLLRSPDPLRVSLFAAAFIQLWPIASSSGFTSMPMGGWFFLLLGWGLAETRWQHAAV